jgi:CHAT domain-containing protein
MQSHEFELQSPALLPVRELARMPRAASTQRLRLLSALVMALACALVSCVEQAPRQDARWVADTIASQSHGASRPILGQLAAGSRYGPRPSGPPPAPSLSVKALVARLEQQAAATRNGDDIAAHAVGLLLTGSRSDAIDTLEELAGRPDARAAWHVALSAAYLERYRLDGRADDLPRAVEWAERALEGEPSSGAALFNRALALEALHLDTDAGAAFSQYANEHRNDAWAAESLAGAHRLLGGGQPPSRTDIESAVSSNDDTTARSTVHAWPDEVRAVLREGVLGRWVKAGEATRAAEALGIAERVSRRLSEATGDSLERDLVTQVREAIAPDRREALSGAYGAYLEGLELQRQLKAEAAGARLATARVRAASASPALAAIVDYHRAIALFQAGDLAGAERMLGQVATEGRLYPRIIGQVGFLRSLIAIQVGEYVRALALLESSRTHFTAVSAIEDLTNVAATEAELYRYLGDESSAWRQQLVALESLGRVRTSTRRQAVFFAGGAAAEQLGTLRTAVLFNRHFLEEARSSGRASAVVEALTHVAANELDLGHDVMATRLFDEAHAQEAAVSVFVQGKVRMLAGRLAMASAPATGAAHLSDALSLLKASGRGLLVPAALRWRADAHMRAGNLSSARSDLQAGIEVYLRNRVQLSDGTARSRYADQVWPLVQALIQDDLRRGNVEQALLTIDQVRQLRTSPGAEPALMRLPGIPSRTALISYFLGKDRLHVWVARQGTLAVESVDVRGADVERTVARMRQSLEMGRGHSEDEALFELYRILIAPVRARLSETDALVIVPDGALWLVPYAALRPRDGRRLIEDFSVSLASSLATGTEESLPQPSREARVVVVAASAATDVDGQPLPALPATVHEARDIERLYGDVQVIGPDGLSRKDIFGAMGRADIFHFAGHSVVDTANAARSRLLVSRDPTQAIFSSDVARLRTLPLLVILASCESAAGRPSHTEGLASLAAAFLASGARAVVANQWRVSDQASRRLSREFHAAIRQGASPRDALRQAQLAMLRDPSAAVSAAQSWAGTVVFGGRTRVLTDRRSPKEKAHHDRTT